MNEELRFERRRYGGQTYTWVYAKIDNEWIGLGDPWPCITPKKSEIECAIRGIKSERERKATEWHGGKR